MFTISDYVYKDIDFSLMGEQIIDNIQSGRSNTVIIFESGDDMADFVDAYREVFDQSLCKYWNRGFAKRVFEDYNALRIDKSCHELWITSYDEVEQMRGGILTWNEIEFRQLQQAWLNEELDESSLPIKSLFCV